MLLTLFLLSIASTWNVCAPSGNGEPIEPYVLGLAQAASRAPSSPHLYVLLPELLNVSVIVAELVGDVAGLAAIVGAAGPVAARANPAAIASTPSRTVARASLFAVRELRKCIVAPVG